MNMLANEMFLDSASLRSSVVSHAKTLGYEPISARAPKAVIDVTLFDSVKATGSIPAGTVFTTLVDDVSYQFVTVTEFTAANIGTSIPFLNIPIYEGTFITTQYIVDSGDVDQRFIVNALNEIILKKLDPKVSKIHHPQLIQKQQIFHRSMQQVQISFYKKLKMEDLKFILVMVF